MKSKKPLDQYTNDEIDKYRFEFVKSTLRRASYRWPWRNIAVKRAWVERGKYLCEKCQQIVPAKEKQLDHTIPVVDIKKGFEGWDKFCERLFTNALGFKVLCLSCHSQKTKKENEARRKHKNG